MSIHKNGKMSDHQAASSLLGRGFKVDKGPDNDKKEKTFTVSQGGKSENMTAKQMRKKALS